MQKFRVLIPVEDGVRKLTETIIANATRELTTEEIEGKVAVLKNSWHKSKKRQTLGQFLAGWVPNQLKEFTHCPDQNEPPETVQSFVLIRPLDPDKLAEGDRAGMAIVGMASVVNDGLNDVKNVYKLGYDLEDQDAIEDSDMSADEFEA